MSPVEEAYERAVEAYGRDGIAAAWAHIAPLPPAERMQVYLLAFNRRRFDLLVEFRADDSVHDMRSAGIPGMGVYRGREGFRDFIGDWLESFPDTELRGVTVEVRERPDGSWAWFYWGTQVITGAGSGAAVDFTSAATGIVVPPGPDRPNEQVAWTVFNLDVEGSRSLFEELGRTTAIPEP